MKNFIFPLLFFCGTILFFCGTIASAIDDYDAKLQEALKGKKVVEIKDKESTDAQGRKIVAIVKDKEYIYTKLIFAPSYNSDEGGGYKNTTIPLSIGAEYMRKISDVVKIGAGTQFAFVGDYANDETITHQFIPIYAAMQIAPFSFDKGLFIHLSIGYNVSYIGNDDKYYSTSSGSFYYSIGLGYEHTSGILIGATYQSYIYKLGEGGVDGDETTNITMGRMGLTVGYRFNI